MDQSVAELERVYRTEATRIRAGLASKVGDVGLAEECVHDAFAEALEHWPAGGVPPNPGGWLTTAARRKAIDHLRRRRAGAEKIRLLVPQDEATPPDEADELLSLVFACCHPALPQESQVALTLRAVCGLTTAEIAAAYLTSEPTMAQRLTRARRTLQARVGVVRVPDPDEFGDRLAEVLAVTYLVFNEGYLASAARAPQRRDLAAQAITLARTLQQLMPAEPEALGLLALLLFHESRAATRFDGWGRLVRLEDQDRDRWDRSLIDEATALLDRAFAMRRPSRYQIEAAIAALHAQATDYASTDWRQIRVLYEKLDVLAPSPIVRLNRAVATRHVTGPEAALAEVDKLADELGGYRLFHAVRGELLGARPYRRGTGSHRARSRAGHQPGRARTARPPYWDGAAMMAGRGPMQGPSVHCKACSPG